MAFALPGAGERLTMFMQFVAQGQSAQFAVELPFDTSIAATITNGLAVAASFQAATMCLLDTVFFQVRAVDAAAPAADAGATIYEVAHINVTLDPSGTSQDTNGVIRFPSPKAGARVGAEGTKSYLLVDIADALITAITAHFDGAVASLSDGQAINTVESGRVIPRKGRPKTV
jgi:hypothetical protein